MGKIHLEGCRAWRTLARLGMAALAAGALSACAQVTPPAPVSPPASVPTPTAAEGDILAGMQQFVDGENNFAFYIPAEWNVFGPDHNAIGSQFIMGPEGTGWTAGEPAAVQISVIDTQAMTLGEALAMLCQGCTAVPTPEPATLTSGLPVLLAIGERASADNGGTVPAPFTIVEYGPKAIIFAVDEARAGMNADTLLATFGPFDGTKPAGENTGRGLYAGIGFALPPAPAHWASGEIVDEVTDEAGGPWWAPAPKHPEIRLVGYPVEGSVQAPRIVVYPVNDLVAANPEAANRVEQLRQLLSGGEIPADAQLPFLPLTNAGGPLQAQVEVVSFEGGRGVRYLTQHGQGPAPINNQELFYTFQGLTDDGAHYVAVILPITNSSLPDSAASVPEAEHQAQLADYGQYVDSTTQALDAQPDTSFQPSLAELDALVQSITIAP